MCKLTLRQKKIDAKDASSENVKQSKQRRKRKTIDGAYTIKLFETK